MPFVKKKRRKPLLSGKLIPEVPGDLCFIEYKKIMDYWNAEKRWTTIHVIAQSVFGLDDVHTARILAFFVFFAIHGMKYEAKQRRLNSDVN